MIVRAEALTAVSQHNQTNVRYCSMRGGSFFKISWSYFTLSFLLKCRFHWQAMRFMYWEPSTTVSTPVTCSLSRRGSTAEADLSVIHKHLRHTTHTHMHAEKPIPFSSHGTKDNWINAWTVGTLSLAAYSTWKCCNSVILHDNKTLTNETDPMRGVRFKRAEREPQWKEIASDHRKTRSPDRKKNGCPFL